MTTPPLGTPETVKRLKSYTSLFLRKPGQGDLEKYEILNAHLNIPWDTH